jgi:hypothetical protein
MMAGKTRDRLTESELQALRLRAIGNTWCVGRKHSPKTLARISAATKGKNVKYMPEEKKQRESIRQASKRFLRRVLKASGRRKEIPSEQYLGYTNAALVAHLGPKPSDDSHIDHYVPIAEFLRRGIKSPEVINALPNLRWLGGDANRRKSASVPADADSVIAICLDPQMRHQALTATFGPNGATYTGGV